MKFIPILSLSLSLLSAPAFADDLNIKIVGSSTVFPFITTVVESFTNNYPNYLTPIVESTGTGGGFKLFCSGVDSAITPVMTGASREIKQSEIDLCHSNGVNDITEIAFGYDALVFAYSKENGLAISLTKEQIWKALSKYAVVDRTVVNNPYQTWNEIDSSLPETPIMVYGPPPTSGTRDSFVELVMDPACKAIISSENLSVPEEKEFCQSIREDGIFIESGENDNLIVSKLIDNPNAFGIFGFSYLDQNSDRLKSVLIDGFQPTFETIANQEYPVSRFLYLYVKDMNFVGMKDFINELQTGAREEGYLEDKGLISLPTDLIITEIK